MPTDDLLGDPEAKAGAGDAFGGEEGLEDAVECGGIHAGAAVGDGDGDTAAGGLGRRRGTEAEAAALGERVDGVSDKVREDLSNLAVVSEDGGYGPEIADDLDLCAAEAGVEDGEDGLNELMDVGEGGAGGAPV